MYALLKLVKPRFLHAKIKSLSRKFDMLSHFFIKNMSHDLLELTLSELMQA